MRYIKAVDSYIEALSLLSRDEYLKAIGYTSSGKDFDIRMHEQILQCDRLHPSRTQMR